MLKIKQGIVPDTSVEDFKSKVLEDFRIHLAVEKKRTAMSDYQQHIDGGIEMLEAVIAYLEGA